MLSNLLTFSHTQQPITTIFYTHKKMGVNEELNLLKFEQFLRILVR